MSLKSRKALFAALQSIPGAVLPKTPKGFSDETYGRRSMIYVRWDSMEARQKGEATLVQQGFKVCPEYDPKSPVSEVQVSYFKGWHWDE
jgi:hypothetical protein